MNDPTDEIELLHQLFTGHQDMNNPDQINSRADPGVELRFNVPDGDGVVYVQCAPFAVQVYPNGTNGKLFDGTWDELQDLIDGPLWKANEKPIREYVEQRYTE